VFTRTDEAHEPALSPPNYPLLLTELGSTLSHRNFPSFYSNTDSHDNMAGLPLRQDSYVLAYRFQEYLRKKPIRRGEKPNPYYESLLANQPEPDPDDQDAHARAIRYAKEHYECYYEARHIPFIIQTLEDRASGAGSTPQVLTLSDSARSR
jgi:hypothetical protein